MKIFYLHLFWFLFLIDFEYAPCFLPENWRNKLRLNNQQKHSQLRKWPLQEFKTKVRRIISRRKNSAYWHRFPDWVFMRQFFVSRSPQKRFSIVRERHLCSQINLKIATWRKNVLVGVICKNSEWTPEHRVFSEFLNRQFRHKSTLGFWIHLVYSVIL